MNFRLKVAGAVVAVAAFGAVGFGPMTASANSPLDVIVFAGPTSGLTPVPAILNAKTPTCITSLGAACSGTYSFNSSNAGGACEGASIGTTPAVGGCVINSPTGSYNNIICGTGSARDAGATVSESDGDVYNTAYSINFVSGVGVITGSATASDGGSGPEAGVVVIIPTAGNCINTDVSTFTAVGAALTTA